MRAVLKWAWIYLRALLRLGALFVYMPGLYFSTLLVSLLPRYANEHARIDFARKYYFVPAVISAGAQVKFEQSPDSFDFNQPCLYVSNHISWMDILALYKVLPIRFISKNEINRWLFFGHLARWSKTIFLKRGFTARKVIAQTTTALANDSIVLFPEGTSSDGRQVRRFLSPIFRAAVDAGVPVVPVSIYYHYHGKNPSGKGVAYIDDDSLWTSVRRTICLDKVDVYIKTHPAIASDSMNVSELAFQAHADVAGGVADLRQHYGASAEVAVAETATANAESEQASSKTDIETS